MKKKKKKVLNKLKDILNSYKTIIWISFLINIILLIFTYHVISSNKIYSFSGEDEYLKVENGLIVLNTDINILNGNNIKYINDEDYDIKEYKIGYYVMDGTKLIEIVSNSIKLDNTIKLSELVNKFTSFNISEKNKDNNYFNKTNKKLLEKGLYLVLEAKTNDNKDIVSKVNLNVSKISNH